MMTHANNSVIWISFFIAVSTALGQDNPIPAGCLEGGRARFIVPHKMGGGYDTFARVLAPHLDKRLGAHSVVENVEEGGGLVGSIAIKEAAPDGRAYGILSATGLLATSLAGDPQAVSLSGDYTILGRVDRSQHVWATGLNSEFKTLEDVFRVAAGRPLVFGVRETGSTGFYSIVLGADLIGLPYELVAGFSGSRDAVLAAVRGDVDLVSYDFDTVVTAVEAGELRPLLQISDQPIIPHPALKNIPLLGGADGIAARRAAESKSGRSAAEAAARASQLIRFIGAGRLIAAPANVDAGLAACLEKALLDTMSDPEFQAAAQKAKIFVDAGSGEEALQEIREVEAGLETFLPVIQEAIRKVRE